MRDVRIRSSDIIAALDAMPAKHCGPPPRAFTAAEDEALLKYQPVRTWAQLAEVFHCSQTTLRKHLRELKAR